jgi:hypothetical protein
MKTRRSYKRDHLSQLAWYDDGHEIAISYHFDQRPVKAVKETAGNCKQLQAAAFLQLCRPPSQVAQNSLKYAESSNIDSLTSVSAPNQENLMK